MDTTDANRTAQSTGLPNRNEQISLFGPPPLFEGEDAKAYDELLMRISSAVKPVDILEEIWVRDLVDLTWDVVRLRRLKSNVMMANAYKGLAKSWRPLWAARTRRLSPKLGLRANRTWRRRSTKRSHVRA
jgi:hypothetical protein